MASSFTTSLRLEIQGTGENRASWGNKTNTNLDMIEEAISGFKTITLGDVANTILTKVNAGTDQSRPMFLNFNGAITADRYVTIATVSKVFFVFNGTNGGKNLIFTTGVTTPQPAGTTYTVPSGQWKMLFTNGALIWSTDSLSTPSSATQRFGIDPKVDAGGVMEVGRYIDFHNTNVDADDVDVRLETGGTDTDLYIQGKGLANKKVWHAGNGGAASGLDADLVDGLHASEIQFAPGTIMLFHSSTAPTGWTKDVSYNDRALRIVNGNITAGGSVAFSSALGYGSGTSSVALTEAQIASHAHYVVVDGDTGGESVDHYHGFFATSDERGSHRHFSSGTSADSGDPGTYVLTATSAQANSALPPTSFDGDHHHNVSGNTGYRQGAHSHHLTIGAATDYRGSSQGHAHVCNIGVQYVDVIFCVKN